MYFQKETLLIHEVIPSMYLLRFRFTGMRDDVSDGLRPVAQVAVFSALTVVDKYIRLLAESELYFAAVGKFTFNLRSISHP